MPVHTDKAWDRREVPGPRRVGGEGREVMGCGSGLPGIEHQAQQEDGRQGDQEIRYGLPGKPAVRRGAQIIPVELPEI